MTVIAINGSPRAKGNTAMMLGWALEEIAKEGFETELIQVGGKAVRGCTACGSCGKKGKYSCVHDDFISAVIPKIADSQAILLGSPVYFSDLTPELKALIDRTGFVLLNHSENPMRRKPGAAVVVARRGGHVHTYDSINHFFGIMQMITVGSRYWNMGTAMEEGAVIGDEEARDTMRILGANMAWLLKKIG
jgi:multimeric flavodoxin WrbA